MTACLGISAYYHDSAAALIVDGKIVAAAQEERFTRKKHDESFPAKAIEYCLEEAGLGPEDLDYVGFYDKPLLKFDRLIETYIAYAPQGFKSFIKAMSVWPKQKLHLPREIRKGLGGKYTKRLIFTEHHESHAASAFYPSPYEEAAILTLDGVGEWATASLGVGRGNKVHLMRELRFPHSVGLLYSAFTYYCGFAVNSGEYKLMGLAPYGEPRYVDLILEKLMDLREDGSFRLDMSYFNYCQGLTMTSEKFHRLFGGPPRDPDSEMDQRHMDLAASIQKVTEEFMLRCARHAHKETGLKNLVLAGGVALNCVGNGRLLREGPFENIWIQPAAGDAGGALGVALFTWYHLLGNERGEAQLDTQGVSLLGKKYEDSEIESFLREVDATYDTFPDDQALCDHVAGRLAEGDVIGWFQDRMEFGPRALGARSILGDARDPEMQTKINLKVKFREGFRPFAPVVLKERASEFFDIEAESPHMLLVAPVREDKRVAVSPDAKGIDLLKQARSVVPAVTHVDYSARVQTVDEKNGIYRTLLESFAKKTGCPVLVNTSFNLGWDPIVCTPRDAYETFMASDIDILCLGRHVLTKPKQPATVSAVVDETSDEVFAGKLKSPCHGKALEAKGDKLVCSECSQAFDTAENIPRLFWPHEKIEADSDVTEMVKAFYEETPFPNYHDHDSIRSLIDKSRKGMYARCLDTSIPYNSSVLEVGCGTGQLTNFLGISCRRVIGTDMCLNSLRLGEEFRQNNGLSRVRFMQMNLFRPSLGDEQFDVVLCNGVLHHTADPRGGYESLVPLVKPGGHIVIGLYNTYGRLFTDARRQLFRMSGGRLQWVDPILRQSHLSKGKRKAWYADQYRHPHESKHTFDEVLEWFDSTGIEFVRGVPSVIPSGDPVGNPDLFAPGPRGTELDHFLAQIEEVFAAGSKEGGFFLMIGRKPTTEAGS